MLQKNSVHFLSGAIELLEILMQRKIKGGLASMNSRVVIDALIDAKDLGKYFQTVITADDVKHAKPHPEIFLKCAQKIDTLPTKCLFIEDSIFGVKAAKAAGMSCIAVATGVYNKKRVKTRKTRQLLQV